MLLDDIAASSFPGASTFGLEEILEIIRGPPRGKAGADDGVLAEFMTALAPEVKEGLVKMLRDQMEGVSRGTGGWRAATVTLIPTVPRARCRVQTHNGPPGPPEGCAAALDEGGGAIFALRQTGFSWLQTRTPVCGGPILLPHCPPHEVGIGLRYWNRQGGHSQGLRHGSP